MEVTDVRRLVVSSMVLMLGVSFLWGQKVEDTPKAAAARKLLDTKVAVDYTDTLLQDVAKDLAEQIKAASGKELLTKIDTNSGASVNSKITHKGKGTVAQVLDEMGKKYDLGYIVINKEYKAYKGKYDGYLLITKGKERGFPSKD